MPSAAASSKRLEVFQWSGTLASIRDISAAVNQGATRVVSFDQEGGFGARARFGDEELRPGDLVVRAGAAGFYLIRKVDT